MKAQALSTFVAAAASLQLVSATQWKDFPPFTCPQNSHDSCKSSQFSGFDWSDLSTGDFSSYGGFDFEGFSCADSFAKRDQIINRNFQSKCISGSASTEPSKCPKVRGSDVDSFSIDTLEISVEFDTELEFYYSMHDGSTCKQKSSCSRSGTTVKNTQCGGATDVTVVLVNPPEDKSSCDFGIHSIGFYCSSSITTSTISTPSTSAYIAPIGTTSTTSTSSTSAYIAPVATTSITSSSSPIYVLPASSSSTSTSTSVSIFLAASSSVSSSTSSSTFSPAAATSPYIYSTTSSASAGSGSALVSTPSTQGTPSSPPAVYYTTVIVDTTVTTCPITNTYTTGGLTSIQVTQAVSTITTTYTSISSPAQGTGVSQPQSSSSCPDILPSCLNTWLSIVPDCSANDDKDCYCPNSNFTVMVFQCLSAYGASDEEISSAQTYFQGICAQYVPQNPAIITAAPAVTVNVSAPIVGPVTTVQVYATTIVACTKTNGPASTTSVITSAVTVPQVVFTTLTGSGVNLVPGTLAPIATTAKPAGTLAGTPTTFATFAPTSTIGNGTTASNPAQFTGAASKSGAAFGLLGAAIAFSLFM